MNKVLHFFNEEEIKTHSLSEIYTLTNDILNKQKFFDTKSLKLIEDEYKNIMKSNINKKNYDNLITKQNNNQENNQKQTYDIHQNPNEIRKKTINTYTKYLIEKNNLNIIDILNDLPNTFTIIYQLNKKNTILFSEINQEFLSFYLTHFLNKLTSVRIENKNKKLLKNISNMSYNQDLNKNTANNVFFEWLPESKIFKYTKDIFDKDSEFGDSIEETHSNLLKYETDYLKSPFDKNKINKIYLDVINNISSKNNKNLLFLKNQKKSETLIKLLIQENMLDFISENIFFEGFNSNSVFYSNKREVMVSDYENKWITKRLYDNVNSFMYEQTKNASEFNIISNEYYHIIRKEISSSMINFYTETFLYYQIMSYQNGLNKTKLFDLYKNNINSNINKINNINIEKTLNEKLNKLEKNKDVTKDINLDEILDIYKELYEHIKNPLTLMQFNEEDSFLFKYSNYHKSFHKEKKVDVKIKKFEQDLYLS